MSIPSNRDYPSPVRSSESEVSYRSLFHSLDCGFCIVEVLFDGKISPVDYRFVEVNRAFERESGLAGVTGRRMRDIKPELEGHWFDIYGRIALTGVPERFESEAAALGRWYDVHAFPVGAKHQHRVAVMFDDITGRKQTEQALHETEARFRTLFDAIKEGFILGEFIRDPTGDVCDLRYTEVAPSFGAMTGLAADAVVGHTVRELFGRIEDVWMAAFKKAGRGTPARAEGYFAGLGRWFDASFTPLGDDRVAILFSDVTNRYRRERELQEARAKAEAANISKSKFLAAASHDLRQPVQSLMLFSQALTAKLAGHPAEGLVAKMSSALDTFKDLLDSLLDLSKLDAGLVVPEVKPCSMALILRELADAYQPRMEAKGLRFKERLGNEWAMVDATLFKRIVSNLLDNALKYTRCGGVLLACRRIDARVRIDVVDTGVGIHTQHLGDIFDEFVQIGEVGREQKQGMGLGLATVKRLATLLGHDLSVRSRPGFGSCFTIFVPMASATAIAEEPSPCPDVADKPCRVLVVDDDWIIVEGMKALLETAGYEVVTATKADEAFALLYGDNPPDGIVADYRLGGSVTGISLIEDARRQTGLRLPAIVITGDTCVRSRSDLMVLHKPVAPDLLKKTLVDICR